MKHDLWTIMNKYEWTDFNFETHGRYCLYHIRYEPYYLEEYSLDHTVWNILAPKLKTP